MGLGDVEMVTFPHSALRLPHFVLNDNGVGTGGLRWGTRFFVALRMTMRRVPPENAKYEYRHHRDYCIK